MRRRAMPEPVRGGDDRELLRCLCVVLAGVLAGCAPVARDGTESAREATAPVPVVAPAASQSDSDDHDGIAGADDRCPNEPEVKNSYEDADGCPDILSIVGRWGVPGETPFHVPFGVVTGRTRYRVAPTERPATAAVVTAKAPMAVIAGVADDGHYVRVRDALSDGRLPPRGEIDIGAMLQRFAVPTSGAADITAEVGPCPWAPARRLLHVTVRALESVKPRDLVLLVDVSDSMRSAGRLTEIIRGIEMARFGPQDRVALVTYASNGAVLLGLTAAVRRAELLTAVGRLEQRTPGKSLGLTEAYALLPAQDEGRTRRVVVISDGDYQFGPYTDDKWPQVVEPLITAQVGKGVEMAVVQVGPAEDVWPSGCEMAKLGGGTCALATSAVDIADALIRVGTPATEVARDVRVRVRFDAVQVRSYRPLHGDPLWLAGSVEGQSLRAGEVWTGLFELTLARPRSGPLATVTAKGEGLTLQGAAQASAATSDEFRTAAAVAWLGLLLRDPVPQAKKQYEQLLALARGAEGGRRERQELVTVIGEMLRRRDELEAQRAEITAFERAHPTAPLPASAVPYARQIGLMLRIYKDQPMRFVGHAGRGEARSRGELRAISDARAWAVVKHLVTVEGIPPELLTVRSAGDDAVDDRDIRAVVWEVPQ